MILNDPVVHEGDPATLIDVRMSIRNTRPTVSRPASVRDSNRAWYGVRLHKIGELLDTAIRPSQVQLAILNRGQPRRIVTAIFKPSQTIDHQFGRQFCSNVPYDTAHLVLSPKQ